MSSDGHLLSQFGIIVNVVTLNMGVKVSVLIYVFISLGKLTRSLIAQPCTKHV